MIKYLLLTLGVAILVGIFYKYRSSVHQGGDIVKQKLAMGALIVDVRTPAEFSMGNYPGAINIPVDQVEKRLSEFGAKDKPIIVYCASGGRSGSAKSFLISVGYTDVTNAGGLSNMPK